MRRQRIYNNGQFREPDRKFSNNLIAIFINIIMKNGKKNIAENIVYNALNNCAKNVNKDTVSEVQNDDIIKIFNKIIDNCSPKMSTSSWKAGGTTYAVPVEIKVEKRPVIALRIITKVMRDLVKKGKNATNALTEILNQAYENSGPAVTSKDELEKKAKDNAAFGHLRNIKSNKLKIKKNFTIINNDKKENDTNKTDENNTISIENREVIGE